MKKRIDEVMVEQKLVQSRSHAARLIKLNKVSVAGRAISKPGFFVDEIERIEIKGEDYVSRAAFKLASVAQTFKLDFKNKTVLDIGSSTGGFTDFVLKNNAKKVIAVDVGTDQLHISLIGNPKIELHEKTDIRDFAKTKPSSPIDVVLADVSFISLREIVPAILRLEHKNTEIVLMCKPQFEAGKGQLNKGVIKNSAQRRDILKNFEEFLKQNFVIVAKSDSAVAGTKGNVERFYLLRPGC